MKGARELREDLVAIQVEAESWAAEHSSVENPDPPDGSWSVIYGIADMALDRLRRTETEAQKTAEYVPVGPVAKLLHVS